MFKKTALLGLLATLLAASAHASRPLPWTEAEVRKVQPAQGKLTLRHGPMEHLDMPGMQMTFRVAGDVDIAQLEVGQRVRVVVNKVDGYYTVTGLERGPSGAPAAP